MASLSTLDCALLGSLPSSGSAEGSGRAPAVAQFLPRCADRWGLKLSSCTQQPPWKAVHFLVMAVAPGRTVTSGEFSIGDLELSAASPPWPLLFQPWDYGFSTGRALKEVTER